MSLVRTSLAVSVALVLGGCTVETADTSSCPTGSSGSSGASGGSGTTPQGGCVRDRDIEASETWSPSACPTGYLVKRDIAIKGTGTELKLEPGTVVKHESDAGLVVAPGAALVAEGTAAQPIVFSGWQDAPGSWKGVRVESNSVRTKLAFATISGAGSSNDRRGALSIANGEAGVGGRAELSDVTIEKNAKVGLELDSRAKLGRFERIRIKDNASGGAHVEAPAVAQLRGTDVAFETNGADNVVTIETNILVQLDEDATWPSVAPAIYRVVGQHGEGGDLVRVNRHLTIEPGAIFELAGGSGFLVSGGTAGMKAVGTADKPVIFRGIAGSSWLGITYGETTWSENRLENVQIRNATQAPEWSYYGTGNTAVRKSSLLLGYNFTTAVQLTLKDVTFAGPNNAPADIAKKAAVNLTLDGANVGAAGGAVDVEAF